MPEMFTLSVDCAGLSLESSSSTESTESTTRAKSKSRSSIVSSEGASRSRSPTGQSSALDTTTSGSTSSYTFAGSASSLTRDGAPFSTSFKPRPSSTPSSTPTKSGRNTTDFSNNTLPKNAQIVIGVVVPTLALLAAVVFGIRAWNLGVRGLPTRRSSEKEEMEEEHDIRTDVPRSAKETFENPPQRPEIELPPSNSQGWF